MTPFDSTVVVKGFESLIGDLLVSDAMDNRQSIDSL